MDPQQEWTLAIGPSKDSERDGAALYIVATPIGNLEDITIRALRILDLVDEILSEDTRKTRILLQRYNIQNELKSFRVHQIRADIQYAMGRLREGRKIALVTDAGTPGISDPGSHLVREVRESLPECPVIPIPGASALSAALSVCGWQANPTVFLGFLPRKPGKQRKALEEAASVEGVLVIYESVHRIQKTLHFIRETLPDRPLLIGREITKVHEEWVYWAVGDTLPQFSEKGEFVILAGPARERILDLEASPDQ